MHFGAHFTEEY